MDIILREYWRVVWQKKYYFALALAALTSATTLDLYVPVFYKNIANGLTLPFSEHTQAMLLDNLGQIALFYGGVWLSWRFLEVAIVPLDGGGVALLEKRCFQILQQQKYAFYENSFSGSLIKKANRFSSSFEIIMDWFLFHFFNNLLAVIISFTIFSQQQTNFAGYFLLWVVAFISWNVGYSTWKLRFDKQVAEWNSKLGGAYSDAINNIFIVKSFALEQREQAHVDDTANETYRRKKIAWILMFISFAVQGLMTFAIELALVYLMIVKWREGNFQVGEFVLFQSILLILIQRLWEFGRNFRNFFSALADASEMADVFRQQDIEKDAPNARALCIAQGSIQFERVCFGYPSATLQTQSLFNEFNLDIRAGEKVALVGRSGSGKTSLTKLLFRFCDPQQGRICYDGIDAREFSIASLRKQISLVPQQPDLFHRSVRDNICLGGKISDEQLNEIARKSGCLEFIESLPERFDTLVGERGVKLSGGEKQRIAIARAFLEKAPILVLDEATSALDSITEKQIQTALFDLMKQKTTLVIAHRLSTILNMDRILLLEQGQIVEEGSHEELLAMHGRYFTMWQHQSGDFLDVL